MCADKLKEAPLVEAIVELRWAPRESESPEGYDLSYNLLVGRLSEQLRTEYSEYEPLPEFLEAPAKMVAENHFVQHRFRAEKDGWPLIQVGPTVFTINETEKYDWNDDFRGRAIDGIGHFFKAHPKPDDIRVRSLMLRYIDAIDFDWEKASLFEFLKENMRTTIALPDTLFAETNVEQIPTAFDFRVSFGCTSPQGRAHLRFAAGQSKGENALIMETMVQSFDGDVPKLPEGFAEWLDKAHSIPSKWFKSLVEGELYRRFQGA
jgi:uncharacterized protein (TIGR04255 family)